MASGTLPTSVTLVSAGTYEPSAPTVDELVMCVFIGVLCRMIITGTLQPACYVMLSVLLYMCYVVGSLLGPNRARQMQVREDQLRSSQGGDRE